MRSGRLARSEASNLSLSAVTRQSGLMRATWRASSSTFGLPTESPVRMCRPTFSSAKSSGSITVSEPTPVRAKMSMRVPPIDPTPLMAISSEEKTACSFGFRANTGIDIFKIHFRTARVLFREICGNDGNARLACSAQGQDDARDVLLGVQRVVRPEERPPHRRVIRSGEPGIRRGVRVQVPEVLDAGHFFAEAPEDIGLEFMVIGAAAVRV